MNKAEEYLKENPRGINRILAELDQRIIGFVEAKKLIAIEMQSYYESQLKANLIKFAIEMCGEEFSDEEITEWLKQQILKP